MTTSPPLKTGTRVRNYGEQYPEALLHGTAVILSSRPSGNDSYEYEVQRDQPLIPNTPNAPTWWASHMTYPAREEPELSL
jgi:hypothetical protein